MAAAFDVRGGEGVGWKADLSREVATMCFSSKRFQRTEPAIEGIAYCVSETFYGTGTHRHGVLHREGQGIAPDIRLI
jgi:hypothetical protein